MNPEAVMVQVRPGTEAAFEGACRRAAARIAAAPDYRSHEPRRRLEPTGRCLLLVRSERLEDHTVGCRQPSRSQEWRAPLHHGSAPFPTVEHVAAVDLAIEPGRDGYGQGRACGLGER